LDTPTREYLQEVERTKGDHKPGIFVPLEPLTTTIHLYWALMATALGVFALIGLCWIGVVEIKDGTPSAIGIVQGLGIGAGLAMLAYCGLSLREVKKLPFSSAFVWIDAHYLWCVTAQQVIVLKWSDYRRLIIDERADSNGQYTTTRFFFRRQQHSAEFMLPSRDGARTIAVFIAAMYEAADANPQDGPVFVYQAELNAMLVLQQMAEKIRGFRAPVSVSIGAPIPEPGGQRAGFVSRPQLLAALTAVMVALVGSAGGIWLATAQNNRLLEARCFAALPTVPNSDESPYQTYFHNFPTGYRSAEVRERYEAMLFAPTQVAASLAPASARYLEVFPRSFRHEQVRTHYEKHLYQATTAEPISIEACKQYLQAFASGQRQPEVLERLDDTQFAQAVQTAERTGSPLTLRQYLAAAATPRHRQATQDKIAGIYDAAIQTLQARIKRVGPADRPIQEAMIALLRVVKTQEQPVVPVQMSGKFPDEPPANALTAGEAAEHAEMLRQAPQLRLTVGLGGQVVSRGDVFAPAQVARREQLVLTRLQSAVTQVFRPDVLNLVAVAPGQTPLLVVRYDVRLAHELYIYQSTSLPGQLGLPPMGLPGQLGTPLMTAGSQIKGLLRSYKLNWTLEVHPTKQVDPLKFTLQSAPAQEMRWQSRSTDPVWAPYAALFYTAFENLADRLVIGLGGTPHMRNRQLTFHELTGGAP
jgi:hypothetical protein